MPVAEHHQPRCNPDLQIVIDKLTKCRSTDKATVKQVGRAQKEMHMERWTEAEWNELLTEVSRRATVDPEFRELALKNSTAALKAVSTRPIPNETSVKFIDNSGREKTVVLPPFVPEVEELSELDLEQVAGGDFTASWRR